MKRYLTALTTILLAALTSWAQNSGKSFTSAPPKSPSGPSEMFHEDHAKQLLANSQVKVYRIELPPNSSTAVNRHEHDFLVVSLGVNEFEFSGSGNTFPMSMRDGEVQVMKGHWPHRVVNKSEHSLHLVEVEIARDIQPEKAVCGLNAAPCRETRFAHTDTDKYVFGTLFETPSIKLAKVEIDPASGMPEHGHAGDHLMIALND